MQVLLNKKEKEQLVIELYRQNKTIREIAQQVHISFGDIGKIIRTLDGPNDGNADLKNRSKETQALHLFSIGKTPLQVAIELDLPATEVHDMQEEFWALNQLYELAFIYDEIKSYLSSFLQLFHSLKEHRMLDEKHLSIFLKYAGYYLPELTYRVQRLANDAIDLEWKKKQSIDKLSWYHTNIGLCKQILSDLETKIAQKQNALHKTNGR